MSMFLLGISNYRQTEAFIIGKAKASLKSIVFNAEFPPSKYGFLSLKGPESFLGIMF